VQGLAICSGRFDEAVSFLQESAGGFKVEFPFDRDKGKQGV